MHLTSLITPRTSLVATLLMSALLVPQAFAQEAPPTEEPQNIEEQPATTDAPDTPETTEPDKKEDEPAASEPVDDTPDTAQTPPQQDAPQKDSPPAQSPADGTPQPMSVEDQVNQQFAVQGAIKQEEYDRERERLSNRTYTYWLVDEDVANPKQLEWNTITDCIYREGIKADIHMQCDHVKKTCLLAEAKVFKPEGGDDGPLVSTTQDAARVNTCYTGNDESSLALLREAGYTLEAALLEAPYGYKRDHRGRIFQRYFDLRSRAVIGVGYVAHIEDAALTNSLHIQTRSMHEHYSTHTGKRHRFEFLQGTMLIDPLRINAKLFEYTMGRSGREPLLYITEFFGEPSRHDIYMNVGWGIKLLEFDYRSMERAIEAPEVDDAGMELPAEIRDQRFLDIAQLKLQWEILQGAALEDYVALQLGGGLGSRLRGKDAAYVYPEIGFQAKWLASPRGLVELSTRGSVRYAVEPVTGSAWLRATAAASAEWVFLSVSDQPISLFVEPQADWLEYRGASDALRELRVTSGIRFSLFTPAPENPKNYEGRER